MKAIALTLVLGLSLTAQKAIAQVVPDNTVGTTVSATNLINGGMRSGNNLFHSFTQFSIPTGGSATFNNPIDIQTIFSRVTGNTQSSIDGLIKAQGNANLFLMNPNGIVFGPNAKLDIGGSFLGTTANSLKFADGVQFSASDMTSSPLLTVSLPVGLQMGTQPGSLQVNGTGHPLVSPSTTLTPYFPMAPIGGLTVQPGKTLALVGGPIDLVGGALTAERGRVELASLGALETAALDVSRPLWKLNTDATQKFADITLSKQSIVDVSGAGAGSIQVQGQRVALMEGSVLYVQNRGIAPAGDIQIKADSLDIVGGLANRNIRSAIINETVAGNSGNISVITRQLNLMNGGSLFSRSFGIGASGNIDVKASESVRVDGFLAENGQLSSTIGTISFSPLLTGRSGNVTVSTPMLSLQRGGLISAATFGNADAGNVNINADRIEVMGRNPDLFESSISSSSLGKGNAGNILVNTRSLFVKDQATINTSSSSDGDAGSIIINARESIEVGKDGYIGSAVAPNSPELIAILNLPLQPGGNAGSVIINAPTVIVRDQASIGVANEGLGNSGTVSITSDRILLDQKAQISAATVLGEGGNVALNSQSLILRRGSSITATAGGSGNGGNITIDSPIIVGLEDSDIIANASAGRGGNIAITTQDIVGLKYRPALTPYSDITASSDFGINGNVQVSTLGIDPANSLNALPTDITDSSRQIADRCGASKNSSFIATGRGGIPKNPSQRRGSDRSWNDLRPFTATNSPVSITITPQTQPLIEASAVQIDSSGTVALIALIVSPPTLERPSKTIGLQAATTCGISEPQ